MDYGVLFKQPFLQILKQNLCLNWILSEVKFSSVWVSMYWTYWKTEQINTKPKLITSPQNPRKTITTKKQLKFTNMMKVAQSHFIITLSSEHYGKMKKEDWDWGLQPQAVFSGDVSRSSEQTLTLRLVAGSRYLPSLAPPQAVFGDSMCSVGQKPYKN